MTDKNKLKIWSEKYNIRIEELEEEFDRALREYDNASVEQREHSAVKRVWGYVVSHKSNQKPEPFEQISTRYVDYKTKEKCDARDDLAKELAQIAIDAYPYKMGGEKKKRMMSESELQKIWHDLPPLPSTLSAARQIMGLCAQCNYCGEVYVVIQRSFGEKKYCPFCGVNLE